MSSQIITHFLFPLLCYFLFINYLSKALSSRVNRVYSFFSPPLTPKFVLVNKWFVSFFCYQTHTWIMHTVKALYVFNWARLFRICILLTCRWLFLLILANHLIFRFSPFSTLKSADCFLHLISTSHYHLGFYNNNTPAYSFFFLILAMSFFPFLCNFK